MTIQLQYGNIFTNHFAYIFLLIYYNLTTFKIFKNYYISYSLEFFDNIGKEADFLYYRDIYFFTFTICS